MKIRRVIVKVHQEQTKRIASQIDEVKETAYTFSYPETKIEFTVSQTDTEQPDGCYVKIYGISKETHSLFTSLKKKGYSETQKIEVFYGYDSELSLVFSGVVDRALYGFDGGQQILSLMITKNARKFTEAKKTVSINGQQAMRQVLQSIAKEYGYKIEFSKDEGFDSISTGRFSHTGTVRDALRSALPSGYSYYINEDSIFVYGKDMSVANEITVWFQNGLLSYPTEDSKQEKTTIKTILIPNIESGMVINIPVDDIWFSSVDTGKYKRYVVKNYVSSFSNGIGTSEFECEGGLDI